MSEARRRLPALLREAGAGRRVAIGRRGVPVAVLVNFEDFRRLERAPAACGGRRPGALEAAQAGRPVVTASVVLASFLPAEVYKPAAQGLLDAFVAGRVRLTAPAFLEYDVLSGLSKAVLGLVFSDGGFRGRMRGNPERPFKILASKTCR